MQSESNEKLEIGFSRPDLSVGFDDDFYKFKQYHLKYFILRSDRGGDSCCMLDGDIIEISFFARSKIDPCQIFVAGRKYLSLQPLFNDPLSSSNVGVFKCTRLTEEIQFFPVTSDADI